MLSNPVINAALKIGKIRSFLCQNKKIFCMSACGIKLKTINIVTHLLDKNILKSLVSFTKYTVNYIANIEYISTVS